MATDDAVILRAAAAGSSIRDIADERGLSEEAVTAILDREAAAWFDGKHLRRELLFEVTRLNALARTPTPGRFSSRFPSARPAWLA